MEAPAAEGASFVSAKDDPATLRARIVRYQAAVGALKEAVEAKDATLRTRERELEASRTALVDATSRSTLLTGGGDGVEVVARVETPGPGSREWVCVSVERLAEARRCSMTPASPRFALCTATVFSLS